MAGADHGAATTRSRSLNPLSVAGSRVPTSRTKRSARPSRGERKCLFSRLLINPEKPDLSEKSAPPALKSIWQSRRHIVCETTIGENDATLRTHEVFYRGFRNRRELAGWVGITPTPWASGNTERDQGVGRDGPAWIRANLIQMAWRWLRHQPDSALSEWFRGRTAGARGRIRRVMIVALARKLLIALWRFSETGLVPSGVRLA